MPKLMRYILLLSGLLLLFHDFLGFVHEDSSGEASIFGIAKFTGSNHTILEGMGVLLVLAAATNKVTIGHVRRRFNQFRRKPTETGRRIAEEMKRRRSRDETDS